jgi:plasmid maintenance system antidote protein VapI
MRRAAMAEPTISGQLRKAFAESGLDFREIADRAGVSRKSVAEFLVGKRSLDSAAIDRIGILLKQELKPTVSS